MSKQKQTC